nr:hypothetical protein [Tanacetum cinerariifolium]
NNMSIGAKDAGFGRGKRAEKEYEVPLRATTPQELRRNQD